MTKKKEGVSASLRPVDMAEGGGLLDDVTVTWDKCRFENWDYGGQGPTVPALKINMTDEEGEEHEQYWTMGKAQDWMPSPSGKELLAVGKAERINLSSNGGMLLSSLVNCGYPEEDIGSDITQFEGVVVHMIRVAEPKSRSTLERTQRADGKTFAKTVLVVAEIKEGIEGKEAPKKQRPGGKKKAKTEAEREVVDNTAAEEAAVEIIVGALADSEEGEIAKKVLPTMAFKALKGKESKKAVVDLIFDDVFLGKEEHPWEYDKSTGVISM